MNIPIIFSLLLFLLSFVFQAPSRRNQFRNDFPNIPLPPSPIHTRWGTWLEACFYYAEHLDAIKETIDSFDSEDTDSIEAAQSLLGNNFDELKDDLAFIKANFSFIPEAIKGFECTTLDVDDGIKTYEDIRYKLYLMRSPVYVRKFDKIIARNANFARLKIIQNILSGRKAENEKCDKGDLKFVQNYSANELAMFRNTPLSSCDVERTFSLYKAILAPYRRSFLFENLKRNIVICCNAENLQ